MSCYTISRARVAAGGIGCIVRSVSGSEVWLKACRYYNFDVDTANQRGIAISRDTITNTTGTPPTPEKLNSRTRAPALATVDAISAATGVTLVIGRVLSVSIPIAWIATPRTAIKAINVEDMDAGFFTTQNADNMVICGVYSEDPQQTFRSAGRRTTKAGHSPFCGSINALFKKTGGGAYELTSRPMFLNDTWFSDRSAWKNGSAQSDAWSIQQFGEPAAVVASNQFLLLGVG